MRAGQRLRFTGCFPAAQAKEALHYAVPVFIRAGLSANRIELIPHFVIEDWLNSVIVWLK